MFEERIGYKFKDADLLGQALTHPSRKKQYGGRDYERLEFLGDSVLSLIISEILYDKYPDEKEGALAKRRAGIVCKDCLADVALDIGLNDEIKLGKGEEQSGGRENKANLEDALEALIAAIYIDGGFEEVRKFITTSFSDYISAMKKPPKDAKSKLQEWSQANNQGLPQYDVVAIEGPAHDPEIEISLKLGDHEVKQKSKSKRAAEKLAAEKLIEKIGIIKND